MQIDLIKNRRSDKRASVSGQYIAREKKGIRRCVRGGEAAKAAVAGLDVGDRRRNPQREGRLVHWSRAGLDFALQGDSGIPDLACQDVRNRACGVHCVTKRSMFVVPNYG